MVVKRDDSTTTQLVGTGLAGGGAARWDPAAGCGAASVPSWRAVVAVRAQSTASEPLATRLARGQPPRGGWGVERAVVGASYGDKRAMLARSRPRTQPPGPTAPRAGHPRRRGDRAAHQRRSGATAACARSANGAGITPRSTMPMSAIASASPPATEEATAIPSPSVSRMYM
jgi:hypothetical protein